MSRLRRFLVLMQEHLPRLFHRLPEPSPNIIDLRLARAGLGSISPDRVERIGSWSCCRCCGQCGDIHRYPCDRHQSAGVRA